MDITVHDGRSVKFATINVGDTKGDKGQLDFYAGNLYFTIDGGPGDFSLYFDNGKVTFGAFDADLGEWVERGQLDLSDPNNERAVTHNMIVPAAGGEPPVCSCGWKSAGFPKPGESAADHLREHGQG